MNKRQIEVEKAKLAAEEKELKHLKAIYKKASDDIAKKISISDGKISVLLENWDDLDEKEKSIYQSQIYQKKFQESLQKQIDGFMKELESKQYKSVDEYLKSCYETGFIGSLYDIAGQGIPLIFPIDQKAVTRAMTHDTKLSKRLYTKLGEDLNLLKKRVANNIARGIATADSYANIARNIANGTNVGINRTMTIARTEGHRIQVLAADDAQHKAKDAGADVVKQWDAALDKRTRPHHRQLDGQIRELDEPFEVAGMEVMYPSGFGRAAEDINCRCALLQRARWALDEDELETLKERAAYYGLDKTKDFDDFKGKYLKAAEAEGKQHIADAGGAKSFKELENYLKTNYNVNMDSSVKTLDFESVKESTKGIEQVLKAFPKANGVLKELSTDHSGIMSCSYNGRIFFNPSNYKDRKSALKTVGSWFHIKNSDLAAHGSHEAGHILEIALIHKGGGAFGFLDFNDCTYAKQVVSAACKAAKKITKKKYDVLKGEISGYAKQDASECMAEAVSDYLTNGEDAAILSKEIWKILKQKLG